MTKTLADFIEEHQIEMTTVRAPENPNMSKDGWHDDASHWHCTLKRVGRGYVQPMTVYFSMGSAHKGKPKLESVLDSIASDSAGVENARGFEDWASDYGYDTDSRSAEKTYRVCMEQAKHLREMLGSEAAYQELLFETERE